MRVFFFVVTRYLCVLIADEPIFSNDNSPHQFIDLSEALETAGTSGYTGAIQYISNDVRPFFLILFMTHQSQI